ncbi:MAG: HDIG domain-containing protein [Calditrichia bacterium]
MNRQEAIHLLKEWTKSESLLLHAAVVENSMRHYARFFNENEEEFAITGLLHDMDYEKYPTEENHPYRGVEFLKEKGLDEKICNAILGHADYTNTPRDTQLAKTLFAVDELSGFITAVCYVTFPGKPKVKSVNKKLKDKSFAAKVNREEILKGIEELGIDKNEHIERVIEAVWEVFEPYKQSGSLQF